MYENFNAPSTESLDSIFNRLQKIVSQLAILGENISQEDLNMKFLRSLHADWNTHVVVWRNKADLDTMADTIVYAFLANQPNGSQLVHEDLEQIHEDDMEEMDLKWHLALLSMRARRLRNQHSSRKTVIVEDTYSKAMVAIDEAGFDWSYMAKYEVPTNMALMDFSDSEDSKNVCIDTSNEIKKALDAPIIKDWVTDSDEDESEVMALKSDNVQHKPEQANQLGTMVQKPVLKNVKKRTGQRVVKPVWNNAMRTNHQNFSNSRRNFAPTAVLTKSSIVPISTARQSSLRAATPVSAARPINTAASKPLVNVSKPRQNALQTTHSLSRRPFYQQTLKNKNLNNNVNAAKANSVNTAKGNKLTSAIRNQGINAGAPQDALKDQGYFDSGCSRYITRNISYLTDFKEHDGGYVAFGGGAKGGKITGKGTIRTATKNGTSRILKSFITKIENPVEKKVKIIRCDNETEFKNRVMNEFCEEKGIKREYSVARTPQVLVVKPHFKTPYELFKDQLGKFDGKSNEGIFIGYSTTSKAFRVYNIKTRKVEENLHLTLLENKPMIAGGGPEWLFDIDAFLKSMNYAQVSAGINSNNFAGKGTSFNAGQSSMEIGSSQYYILMPLWKDNSLFDSYSQALDSHNKDKHGPSQASESDNHERLIAKSSTKTVNTARPVNTATPTHVDSPNDPLMPDLEDAGIFDDAYDDRD
nr:hypothetical protein [Tanacetum cinerariifolium]